jgi:hypothetical protein
MIKFILTSFLLLLLLGTVYSDSAALKVVAGNKGCKTSKELRGYYSQQDSQAGGYHKAEVYFKTKVQSMNPDQAGVSKINCKDNKITLSFNDKNAIKQINNWPNKVMLLISHKWECFGKTTTQFFMIEDKTIDTSNKKVTFTVEKCNITEWTEDFLLDVSWEKGKTKRHSARAISLPPINENRTISLNVFFDEKTGKTSNPNIPLIEGTLFCANCFVNGAATIALRISGKFSPTTKLLELSDASVSLNGNVKLNLDLAATGAVGDGNEFSRQLLNIPIPPGIGVPSVFSIGPSIELVASTELFSGAESTINFGGEVEFPKFSANATFVDEPKFVQSGFEPVAKSHGINIDVGASVGINSSLKPRLAFGLDVLNGIFSQQVGFQLVAALNTSVSVGDNKCQTDLNGDLGFFLNNDDFPIFEFPKINLLNTCV